MNQYFEQKDPDTLEVTSYTFEGMSIPPVEGNRHYQQMQAELAADPPEAEIIPWTEYRDLTDEQLREQRYDENAAHAKGLPQLGRYYLR
jgi:hypothetical protein